jgi:hypothetical protein
MSSIYLTSYRHSQRVDMSAAGSRAASNFLPSIQMIVRIAALSILAGAMAGCGSGVTENAPQSAPIAAPAILVQPADQSVPMGLPASYVVSATGVDLQYQWARNGEAIAGAISATYTSSPTTIADAGAAFSVTVSNAMAAVVSRVATLAVTARAPMTGDLRFEQVDAPLTVNGWGSAGVGISTELSARSAAFYSPTIGTPFYVGSGGNCGPMPATDGTGCAWFFSVTPLATALSGPILTTGYGSDDYANFQLDLQNAAWPAFNNGPSVASSFSVITSLDLEPANELFAVSWIQSTQQSGFSPTLNTVPPEELRTAAATEGSASRVITAISNDNGAVSYLSYAWQADTTTQYESQIVTAAPSAAGAAAANLAAEGYIITASGSADAAGEVFLVGTRVQGDTMPRPFMSARSQQVPMMLEQGYAIVAVIFDLSQADPYIYLGER